MSNSFWSYFELYYYRLIVSMENMLDEDVATNKSIGKHGAEHILKRNDSSKAIILTHCNTVI